MKIKIVILMISLNFLSCKNNGPELGVYDVDGCKIDIYCGNSNYIEFKREGENRIIEFYTGSRNNKSCSTFGHFKIDENNNLTIYGLSNPNTYGAAEQFNGEYKWIKGTNKKLSFYNSCFYKNNSDIVLLSNQEEN
jgi:hypothetical protein